MFRPGRIAFLFVLLAFIVFVFIIKLYRLQIVEGTARNNQISTYSSTETVTAVRGDILDRNGTLLVTSNLSYDVTLSRATLLEQENMNEILSDLAATATEYGISYTDTFPITMAAPFAFLADTTYTQRFVLKQYLEFFELDPDISAIDFIIWLKDHYNIDYTIPTAEARVIIGLRYELESRVITAQNDYIFASNATSEFISILDERGYPGVSVEVKTNRVYKTEYAAHLLGYIGKMNEEEYKKYKEAGYPMDAMVGKEGVEGAFEDYLHGTDGTVRVLHSEETDAIVGMETVKEAKNGANVYLSLDIGLQEATENALRERIEQMNSERESGKMITGGGVAVVSPKTGEALAIASYPSFDISSFFENYEELVNDSTAPLFNRALYGIYNPGSTYKMVTGFTGLYTGYLTKEKLIYDGGIYTAYPDYQPRCWIYAGTHGGHGELDIVNALRVSCNVFFFTVGDNVGSRALAESAAKFGFGSHTGIEIGDAEGIIATEEYKHEVMNEPWFAADTLLASIGQGQNRFTPLQLSNYAATIANGGTRHNITLLNSVKDADYSETLLESKPTVAYEFTAQEKEYVAILQEGMDAVGNVRGGSGFDTFAGYKVRVACKTGTVQSDTDSNNGVFVCYAPAEDPEIAIGIVVERGSSGREIMIVARDILDYYFSNRSESVSVASENSQVR